MGLSGMFDYTQKKFWGGSWYPYWSLIVISIFGGLFGLDHFWLRSPVTGMLKFVMNILTLGLWYFYDLLQILGEKDFVMKNGLSAPIVGPLGIGAGMFTDDDPSGPRSKSPFRWIAYMILVCLPFGFDFYLAGDTMGAMARFLTCFIIFLWPIGFIWGCLNMVRAFCMPKAIFTDGMYRMFPVNWFMDTKGPNILGPVDFPEGGGKECSSSGYFGLLGGLVSIFGESITYLIPGVRPAIDAVSAATQATAGTVKAAANSATTILEAATGPAVQTVSTVSSTVREVPKAISAIPTVASGVTRQLETYTTAEGLKRLAKAQAGGGLTAPFDTSGFALLAFFTVVLGGGALLSLRYLNTPWVQQSIRKDAQRNDAPPESRSS